MKLFSLIFAPAALLAALLSHARADETPKAPIRVYSHLLNPKEHPDYARRPVKPPTWETFENRTQFTVVRHLTGDLNGLKKLLDRSTVEHDLGTVIRPSYGVLFLNNLDQVADELKNRKLYMFDSWGYVPGGAGGFWNQFQLPEHVQPLLREKLGDRWLGTDVGEQDSRFIVQFSDQITPATASRFDNYLNFQRHFEFMGDELGNHHSALVGMTYGHYLLKEGTYSLLGAETIQGHMNAQVFYSFIRGAGKQHGVPWFGDVSIYSPAGFKMYGPSKDKPGTHHLAGSSLSLMKRLLYTHIFYNCMIAGFEEAWFWGDYSLSPVGRIQQSANRWAREHGSPGVQHTGVALMFDFEQGWRVPTIHHRPHYSVWSRIPYDEHDFLADNIFHMFYPNYVDSYALADETSYSTATPYGDMLDCLLTDAPQWVLDQYGVVVMIGKARDAETTEKLKRYVAGGGHLVLVGEKWVPETGRGRVTVLPGTGLEEMKPEVKESVRLGRYPGARGKDGHFQCICPLTPTAREILDGVFKSQQLFDVGPNLGFITCRKRAGEYTLAVLNNTWGELPFKIESHCGPIESIQEMVLDSEERKAEEYMPRVKQVENPPLGANTAATIAGGDIRIFAVRVREAGVIDTPRQLPPARPKNVVLAMKNVASIKEEVLRRPTFFQHYGGVSVDSDYLRDRELESLEQQAGWIQRQGLIVIVNLTGPPLGDSAGTRDASITALESLFKKMQVLGARNLSVSLAGGPSAAQLVKSLSGSAKPYGVTLFATFGKATPTADAVALVKSVNVENVKVVAPLANAGDKPNPLVGLLAVTPDQLSAVPRDSEIPVLLTVPDGIDGATSSLAAALLPQRIMETNVVKIPATAPNPRRSGVILSLRNPVSIDYELLRQPTLTDHCDGVMVDWNYLCDRESETLQHEAARLKQKNLKLFVDLTPGLNMYPDLRLVNNSKAYFESSMKAIAEVMKKMQELGSHDLLLSLHAEARWDDCAVQIQKLAQQAKERGVSLYMRTGTIKGPPMPLDFFKKVASDNLKFAIPVVTEDQQVKAAAAVPETIGVWLINSPQQLELVPKDQTHPVILESTGAETVENGATK